jgi:hypothetical protein
MRLHPGLCVALASLLSTVGFAGGPQPDIDPKSDQLTTYVAQFEPGTAKPPELVSTLDSADPFRKYVEAGVREALKFTSRTGSFRLRKLGTHREDTHPGMGAVLVLVLFDAPLRTFELSLPPPGEVFVYSVSELRTSFVGVQPERSLYDRATVGPSSKVQEHFDSFYRLKVDPSKTELTLGSHIAPDARWTAAEWKGELKPGTYSVVTDLDASAFPPDVLSVRSPRAKSGK